MQHAASSLNVLGYQSSGGDSANAFAACPDEIVVGDEEATTRNAALFFLKMKTQYGLADFSVLSFVNDLNQMMAVSSYQVTCGIAKLFEQYGISSDVSIAVNKIIEDSNWQKAAISLSIDCKRNAYYKDNFPYVPCEEYKFAEDCLITDCFQYVSIIATLRQLLQNAHVRSLILNPLPVIEGHLSTF
jgi:hypothetical protein